MMEKGKNMDREGGGRKKGRRRTGRTRKKRNRKEIRMKFPRRKEEEGKMKDVLMYAECTKPNKYKIPIQLGGVIL